MLCIEINITSNFISVFLGWSLSWRIDSHTSERGERRKWTSASVNKPDLEIHCIYTKVIYHINLEHRNRMKYKSWLTEINKWGRDRVRGKKNLAFTKQEMARKRGKTFKEKWTKEQTVKKIITVLNLEKNHPEWAHPDPERQTWYGLNHKRILAVK